MGNQILQLGFLWKSFKKWHWIKNIWEDNLFILYIICWFFLVLRFSQFANFGLDNTDWFCSLIWWEHQILQLWFVWKKLKKMARGKKICENVGFRLVRSTSFGRKRVCLPDIADLDFISTTPTKKLCRQNSFSTCVKSHLEALPQDILVSTIINFLLMYLTYYFGGSIMDCVHFSLPRPHYVIV